MSNIAEGFERTQLPEKLHFALRGEIVGVGKLVSGLTRSTEDRKLNVSFC